MGFSGFFSRKFGRLTFLSIFKISKEASSVDKLMSFDPWCLGMRILDDGYLGLNFKLWRFENLVKRKRKSMSHVNAFVGSRVTLPYLKEKHTATHTEWWRREKRSEYKRQSYPAYEGRLFYSDSFGSTCQWAIFYRLQNKC